MDSSRLRIKTQSYAIHIQPYQLSNISHLKRETQQLRRLKKTRLKTEIEESRKQLQMLNSQIMEYNQHEAETKRKSIEKRLQDLSRRQAQRDQYIKNSNQSVRKIKLLQELQEIQFEKKIKDIDKSIYTTAEKVLKQKRSLLVPIKFEELAAHQEKYDQKRKIIEAMRQAAAPLSTSRKNYTPPHSQTKAYQIVRQEFEFHRNKQQSHKQHAKSQLNKRIAYGEEAQQKFRHAKPKKQEPKPNARQIQTEAEYKAALKSLKKKQYKFIDGDIVNQTQKQIKKIKNGPMDYFDKFEVLNNLSKGCIEKYSNGKSYAIQLAAQANLALADLYLKQEDTDEPQ